MIVSFTISSSESNGNYQSPDFRSPRYVAFFVLVAVSSALAALCSFTVANVVFHMLRITKHKGHLKLINAMSISQLIYDLSYFFGVTYVDSPELFVAATFLQRIFGSFSTLFTNYIAFVAYYSISRKAFVDINKWYRCLLVVSLIPGIVMSILYVVPGNRTHSNYLYFWFRVASIGINIVLCSLIFFNIYKIRSNKAIATSHDTILKKLAIRMMYYPVIQAASRSAIAWYEYSSNFVFSPFDCGTTAKYAGLLISVVLNPSASYGYLIIFFIMQPRAYLVFRSQTYLGFCSCWNAVCCFLPRQVRSFADIKLRNADSNLTPSGWTPPTPRETTHGTMHSQFSESPSSYVGDKVDNRTGSLFDRDFDDDDDFLMDLYSQQSGRAICEVSLCSPFANFSENPDAI
jgi:hypothetical protein